MKRGVVRFQVAVAFVLTFLLQSLGFFSPYWAVENKILRGLFYKCYTNNGSCTTDGEYPSRATLGLQSTAFIMLSFTLLMACVTICCYGPDEDDDIMNDSSTVCQTYSCFYFYCWILFYPVTAILNLVGCIVFASSFKTELLSWSFYMCIASGCLMFLMIFVGCFDLLCSRSRDEHVYKTLLVEIYEDS